MGRAGVHFLAADVGEDRLPVARIVLDQPPHLGQWRGDALLVGIVEGEAHSEDDAALEALARVRGQPLRVAVAAPVEQERGDRLDRLAVEVLRAGEEARRRGFGSMSGRRLAVEALRSGEQARRRGFGPMIGCRLPVVAPRAGKQARRRGFGPMIGCRLPVVAPRAGKEARRRGSGSMIGRRLPVETLRPGKQARRRGFGSMSGRRLPVVAPRVHAGETPLGYMQHTHHHRRQAGPLDPATRPVDLAAVLADPAQSRRARVALGVCAVER